MRRMTVSVTLALALVACRGDLEGEGDAEVDAYAAAWLHACEACDAHLCECDGIPPGECEPAASCSERLEWYEEERGAACVAAVLEAMRCEAEADCGEIAAACRSLRLAEHEACGG